MTDTSTFSHDAPVCPYCGHEQMHDGNFFFDESMDQHQCDACEKIFNMSIHTSTSWRCERLS